jgi:hypothetical protein
MKGYSLPLDFSIQVRLCDPHIGLSCYAIRPLEIEAFIIRLENATMPKI